MGPENHGSATRGATVSSPAVRRGGPAGLAGSLVGAAALWTLRPSVLTSTAPAVIGLEGALAGWFVVVALGTAAGIGFASLASLPALSIYRRSPRGLAGLSVVYATVLWLLGPALAVPLWLSILGAGGPPAPWFEPSVLVGHVGYGLVLGVGYWSLR